MSDFTVTLPHSVPFPVTISAVLCKVGDQVHKHQPLFKYKYWDYQDDPRSTADPPVKVRVERIGTYECPVEGTLATLKVGANREVGHSGVALASVLEPCAHAVQYGGLCALCGKAVEDEKDYTGYNYEDRATISMAHDSTGLRVSYDEALKLDHDTTHRLAQARKLILVVDLDQTVIHATVDPTVGEWQLDPANPNYKAVKDVQSFCLEEEQVPPPNWNGPRLAPTKCWYYVKLRPGLPQFLKSMADIYEMHIYTMATRNYALAIAKIIDPEGTYFGDRILSRDESGSLTHKNLKRLFPVDQSMVAIIDDRGDVWQWEENLIKVVPYEFFVGIGDINSSFLPKKRGELTGPMKRRSVARAMVDQGDSPGDHGEGDTDEATGNQSDSSANGSEKDPDSPENSESSDKMDLEPETDPDAEADPEKDLAIGSGSDSGPTDVGPESENKENEAAPDPTGVGSGDVGPVVDRMLEIAGGEDNKKLLLEQSRSRTLSLEQQQHDRPLAKLQHDLEKINHDAGPGHGPKTDPGAGAGSSVSGAGASSPEDLSGSDSDDNLLFDDDTELQSLNKALTKIHTEYYTLLDTTDPESHMKPDLTKVIPYLKSKCLDGIVILFSGLIPLGIDLDSADIVVWCKQFGVKVVNEVFPEVTHVVCRDPNKIGFKSGLTFKAKAAKRLIPGVKIVNPDWLFACLSNWKRMDEEEYLIEESDDDWHVNEGDISKYQRALERAKETKTTRPRFDSVTSMEDYDLDQANQEVDDFLADLSGDEELDGDGDEGLDLEEDEQDRAGAKDSFIKNAYRNHKRKYEELLDEELDEESAKRHRPGPNGASASTGTGTGDEGDLAELEQEILDGFDEIE